MNQQFRNIVYLSDRSGTGVWRRIWPTNSLNCLAQNINAQVDYSQTPILDQNYYKGVNSITVQRWIAPQQKELFCRFFKPLMDQECGWTIYEIDDLMFDGTLLNDDKKDFISKKYGTDMTQVGIPLFNRGRKAFEGVQVQSNIKEMLNTADFVTVTTDHIKEVYHDLYDVPLDRIIAVPNLLPRYLFDDRYNPDKKLDQLRKNRAKPRIGIVSSLSHYNIDNVRCDSNGKACRKQKQPDGTEVWINELGQVVPETETRQILDDIDEILECIRSTVNDFQWVFFGFCPPKLKDLVDKKKIEVHGGVPIMNYPSYFDNLGLQAIVACINKVEFNYCKSFIKTMECAALGVPCFATNCLPYNRVMPREQLFDDGVELKEKLLKFKFIGANSYKDILERQWRWLNSPCTEGDFNIKNFWLEDNLNIYIDLARLRQKSLPVSLKIFEQSYMKRREQEQQQTVFKNENIQIVK